MSGDDAQPSDDLDGLLNAVKELAQCQQLLVACDYDGTIAPIVADPMAALPTRETSVALRALATLPQTHVAVISGRSLRDLAALSRFPAEIHLVGSHGSEFDIGFGLGTDDDARALRSQIETELSALASSYPGAILELKPASVALHYRNIDESDGEELQAKVLAGPATLAGVHVKLAKMVVELSVIETDKGKALETIRHRIGATAVLYLGDDKTDEDAFATLTGPDVGVKVGEGDSAASWRVGDTQGVARLLATIEEAREEWLAGSGLVPIEDHSLLSDQRTAAIVTPDARVTWLCVPRIDSAAVFAELVGGPTAGYFSVAPAGRAGPATQRYLGDTMVLETTWENLSVTDYLDCSGGRPELTAGRTDLIRVISGSGTAVIDFAPRLDFGRFPTRLVAHSDGLEVSDASDLLVLRSPGVAWEIVEDGIHQSARAEVDLSSGPLVLELRCGTNDLREAAIAEGDRRIQTETFWSSWAAKLSGSVLEPDLVRRSALALKALVHGPTGAILAAATTSLPEHIGGVRNWDYRYCWLRDASMTANSLVHLGSNDEALAFLDWLLSIIESRDEPERLQPLYLVTGRHLPPEADIADLAGYAGSRPVRVGNAAEHQVQLDVFGPVVDLVHSLVERDAPLSAQHWRLVEAMVNAVANRWQEPDHGIWEIRKPPRHHVFSKVMCWLTVDRGVRIAERFMGTERTDWIELRDTIAAEVLDQGWNETTQSFGAAYDGDDLDASSLAVGLSGMIPPDDPRFASTIRAVEDLLRNGPTVYRYKDDDGLPGAEGGFNLMTSWLIDAYAMSGRPQDARALFDSLVGLAGATGLMCEEYDPSTGRGLGNHPQAYSHLGLINNALTLGGLLQPTPEA
jgi:trehalose 6-phosphate phosphatase